MRGKGHLENVEGSVELVGGEGSVVGVTAVADDVTNSALLLQRLAVVQPVELGRGVDQRADYLCYTPGDGGTWTYLRNTSTGDQGWVRDDLLPGYGSNTTCEEHPPPSTVRT